MCVCVCDQIQMGHDGVVQTSLQTADQREANQPQMMNNYPVPYLQQQHNINTNIAAYNPNDQNVNFPHHFDNLPPYVSLSSSSTINIDTL